MTPDLIVDDLVIVDPKVVEEFNQDHLAYVGLSRDHRVGTCDLNQLQTCCAWKRIVKSGGDPNGEIIL